MTDRELMQQALDALTVWELMQPQTTACAVRIPAIEALRARLANEFNPDWDQVEALQESLREHMAEIQRLRARLVQPEQEPVAWMHTTATGDIYFRKKPHDKVFSPQPVYTAPPQREWQSLTDEEIMKITGVTSADSDWNVLIVHKWVRAIEERLKEKNHA